MNDKTYKLYKSLSKEFVRKGIASNRFSELEQLYKIAEENQKLRHIIQETLWMARRYADGRSTYTPETVNKCIDKALELGIDMSGPPEEMYASDGMFGKWNSELKMFEK
jgi:hypothetical protein